MGNDLAACALSLLVLAKAVAGNPSVSSDEDGNLHIVAGHLTQSPSYRFSVQALLQTLRHC